MRKIPFLLLLLVFTGCAAVLVGGLFYKSAKSNAEKREFTTWFQRTNLEREQADLRPLDWCSETYKFDPGWAIERPACKERIERYENGDTSALDMGDYEQPEIVKPDTSLAEPDTTSAGSP